MEIALLRHGKPDSISTRPVSASQFSDWITAYNNSGIAAASVPPVAVVEYARKCCVVVCSSLPRSIQSAELLHNSHPTPDSVFIEAGMPYARWSTLKLPPEYWAVLFRVLWFAGYSANAESYSDAAKRSVQATAKLITLAQTHQSVMLAGHGIFNRLIARELKSQGWSGSGNTGSKYWDFSVYKNT